MSEVVERVCHSCGKKVQTVVQGADVICTECGSVLDGGALVSETEATVVRPTATYSRGPRTSSSNWHSRGGSMERNWKAKRLERLHSLCVSLGIHVSGFVNEIEGMVTVAGEGRWSQGKYIDGIIGGAVLVGARQQHFPVSLLAIAEYLKVKPGVVISNAQKIQQKLRLETPQCDPADLVRVGISRLFGAEEESAGSEGTDSRKRSLSLLETTSEQDVLNVAQHLLSFFDADGLLTSGKKPAVVAAASVFLALEICGGPDDDY